MMFDVMDGENWPEEYQSTWHNRSVDACEWHGVRCDENGELIGITLPSTGNEKMFMQPVKLSILQLLLLLERKQNTVHGGPTEGSSSEGYDPEILR